jgi:proteasome beta subunit
VTGKIFFYDMLGAQFESVDFCTTGSGSTMIRGALYYHNRWDVPLSQMDEGQSLELILKMLETAAEFDTATCGFRPIANVFPQVMRVNAAGISSIEESVLESLYETRLSQRRQG